jgi:hypothetical protein
MADKPKKKKSTPKTPFEKIGAAYESEARRQEKSGNTEMATKTRKAAAKSMTPANKKALEESAQTAKDKKKTTKKKSTSKKVDAVEAAGAKAKDAVTEAKERNPISQPASEGDKQGPPSPAGSKDNTGSGTSTQRTPKPSSKDRPKFGSVAEQREKNPPPGNPGYTFGSVAEQRAKAGPVEPSKLRAGAEGTSGKSGPAFRQNDITTEMPETRREKDEARTARIRKLANANRNDARDDISKDPSDKGEMPSDPTPRQKPTVMVTPTKDGEMPKADKPGFMSRLRSRIGSFTSRPGAPAATSTPPPPPPSGSGGGSTPPPPPPSGGKKLPDPTPDSPRAINNQNSGYQVNRGLTMTGSISGVAEGANVFSAVGEGAQLIGDRNTTQNITGGAGQPITATTTGKATSSGGRGITASTSGTASSHPRAQNASRGGRPTSRKK